MPLRDYQEQAVHELRAVVRRSDSVVYQLATGAGKTPVAGEIARLASQKGSRTMFFMAHRRELIKQAVDTFTELCPNVQLGVEAAGWPTLALGTAASGFGAKRGKAAEYQGTGLGDLG